MTLLRRSVQSLLIPVLFLSMLNIFYTFLMVVFQSWRLTWWIDRRFPFNMIPLWAFCLVSFAAWVISVYHVIIIPKNHLVKLGCDRANVFFLYMVFGCLSNFWWHRLHSIFAFVSLFIFGELASFQQEVARKSRMFYKIEWSRLCWRS